MLLEIAVTDVRACCLYDRHSNIMTKAFLLVTSSFKRQKIPYVGTKMSSDHRMNDYT